MTQSQQVNDENFQLSLPGHPGGQGGDEEEVCCAIVGLIDRMTDIQ